MSKKRLSGAPFRVVPGGFALTDLNDTEKKILKNAMAQQKHINVLIRTKEEHIFIGDLLTLQSRITTCVIQISTMDGIEYLAEGLKHSFIKMVLFRTAFNQRIDNSIAIKALKETKSLRTIDLGVSAEQNAVVEALSNPNIETFNLRNLFNHQAQMDLNDETFERFAAVLATHPTLTQLSLGLLSHASFTALGEALKHNVVLQNLIINEENGSESMRRLCEGLKMSSSVKSLSNCSRRRHWRVIQVISQQQHQTKFYSLLFREQCNSTAQFYNIDRGVEDEFDVDDT